MYIVQCNYSISPTLTLSIHLNVTQLNIAKVKVVPKYLLWIK